MKNGMNAPPARRPAEARPCPRCEERPCVPGQRLCQPCRADLQRNNRAKHRSHRLEVAARRILTLMPPETQRGVRRIAEEQQQPLSMVLAGLAARALEQ